jgi:hypothetical protein
MFGISENHVTTLLAPLFDDLASLRNSPAKRKPQLTSSVHQCNNHHSVHPSAPSTETWPLCSSPPRLVTYRLTFRTKFSYSSLPFLAIQLVENCFPSLRTYIVPRNVGVASTRTCISTLSSLGGTPPPLWKVDAEKKASKCRMRLVITVPNSPKSEDLHHGLGSSYLSRGMIHVNSFSGAGTQCFGTTSKCEARLLWLFCSII